MDALKRQILEQLAIVLVKRNANVAGRVSIPIDEFDDTYQDILVLEVDEAARTITFQLSKKS